MSKRKKRRGFLGSKHRWDYIIIGLKTLTSPNKVRLLAHDVDVLGVHNKHKIYHELMKRGVIHK